MGTFADFLDDVETEKPQSKNVPAPIRNNNPGALMPGGKLAQYKTPEEGLAAIDKNLASYGKKGVSTLTDVISKWAPSNENDTNAYIAHVAKVTGLNPNQKIDLSNPLIRHQISAGIVQQENGTKAIYQPSEQSKSTSSDFGSFLEDVGETPSQAKSVAPVVQQAPQVTQTAPVVQAPARQMNAGEKMYQNRINALKDLGIGLSSLADVTVGNILPGIAGPITYNVARALQQNDQQAQATSAKVTGALEKPFGKTFGVTETPAYKNELSQNALNFIGENINKGAQYISEKTGIPTGDVQSYINSLTLAAGKPVGQAMGKVGGAALNQGAKLAQEFKEVTTPPMKTEIAQPSKVMAGSTGAAKATTNPYPKFTGQETGKGGEFPMVKLSNISKDVAPKEQQTRAQIATEILGDKNAVRTGVITGNEDTLRNEHTEAKSSNQTPKAQVLRDQLAREQNALSNYAQDRIKNTGASQTLTSDYERGQAINDAFAGDQGLTGFFKTAKNQLYDEAKTKVGENPIKTGHVDTLLNNEQFRAGLGLKGNEGVASSAEKLINLAKTVGFEDEFGNKYAPNTIGAWDAVRKSLNSEWTKDNASVIRKINTAIDKDIAGAGGQELYKKADQLHQAEKTLFSSKGIKSIFGDIDPNGVQTGTPFENIPQKLNSIPKDEWAHIFDTADKISKGKIDGPINKETGLPNWSIEVPEEVRQNAERAKAEIKGAIAREIYEKGSKRAGVWNQNDVTSILNARAEKIKHAFDPEEIKAFHTLNVGGQIMPGVHGYEGAGLQEQRLGMLASHAPKIGAATGASIGSVLGPTGTAVGGYLGQRAGTAFEQSSLEKALNKAATETQKEMKKNAQKASILNLRENKKD